MCLPFLLYHVCNTPAAENLRPPTSLPQPLKLNSLPVKRPGLQTPDPQNSSFLALTPQPLKTQPPSYQCFQGGTYQSKLISIYHSYKPHIYVHSLILNFPTTAAPNPKTEPLQVTVGGFASGAISGGFDLGWKV